MQAKVKETFRWKTVIAFGGHEYVKGEWRPVPAGLEQKAKEHPFLDVLDETVPEKAKAAAKKMEEVVPSAEAKLQEMVASQPIEIPVEVEPEEKKAKPARSKKE